MSVMFICKSFIRNYFVANFFSTYYVYFYLIPCLHDERSDCIVYTSLYLIHHKTDVQNM